MPRPARLNLCVLYHKKENSGNSVALVFSVKSGLSGVLCPGGHGGGAEEEEQEEEEETLLTRPTTTI